MMIFTSFILTIFLKSTVIDSMHHVTSYGDSSVRIKRNVGYGRGNRGFYTAPPFGSSEESDIIERRLFKNSIINTNKNYNFISVPMGPPPRQHHKPRDSHKTSPQPVTEMTLPPETTPLPETEPPSEEITEPPPEPEPVIVVEDDVLEKLRAAAKLRDNAITMMGYLLQLPPGRLTLHQYASLEMIYNALRERTVYMYNLLPILEEMKGKSGSIQLPLLLNRLISNLPSDLIPVVEYLLEQIEDERMDLNSLLKNDEGIADLLTGIDENVIEILSVENPDDEIESDDEQSEITKELLGPVYVKIFQQLCLENAELPQSLFGIILSDLPNPDRDPIFEEYIRYIAKETEYHRIPNWSSHGHNPKCRNPYTLLANLVDEICSDKEVSSKMKKLLLYVLCHIKRPEDDKQEIRPTNHDINLDLLLFSVAPLNYDELIQKLGSQLANLMAGDERIDEITSEINRYRYPNPREQIFAFLAKLLTKLTDEEREIERTTSALLSTLILIREISSPVVNFVPLWMVINVIDGPEADPKIHEMIDYITHEIFQNVILWSVILKDITPNTAHCKHPKVCVLSMLGEMQAILATAARDPQLMFTFELLTSAGHDNLQEEQQKEINCDNRKGIFTTVTPISDEFYGDQQPTTRIHGEILSSLPDISFKPVNPPSASIFDQANQFLSQHQPNAPETLTTVKPVPTQQLRPIHYEIPPAELHSPELSKLPPSIDPKKCIIFTKTSRGSPVIQTQRSGVDYRSPGAIILPSIVHLDAKPHNETHVITMCESQFQRRIVKPLMTIYGTDYVGKIVGRDRWSHRYPTRIALMIGLLEKASWDHRVQKHTKLIKNIGKTLEALEYVAPYILLPLIAHFMNFDRPITWVSFGNNTDENLNENPTKNIVMIARGPPDTLEVGPIYTMPIVNPKYWLQPIGDKDPYPSLLPKLPKNSIYEVALRPLVSIFKASSMKSLLGNDIKSTWYPNKGALFISTLHRLRASDKIKSDKILLDLIENYLRIILPASIYVRVPPKLIIGDMNESSGHWTVDLLGLLKALPIPSSKTETTALNNMRDFLARINLLDEFRIPLPPLRTTKGQFLTTIIKTALEATKPKRSLHLRIIIDDRIKKALIYYKDKVLETGAGSDNIDWIWIQKLFLSEKAHIGETIAELMPYNDIPRAKKPAYTRFVSHLKENPHLLNVHNELPIEEHKTKGTFINAFLRYLLKRRDLKPDVKKNINQLLPHVPLTGRGARHMPPARVEAVH